MKNWEGILRKNVWTASLVYSNTYLLVPWVLVSIAYDLADSVRDATL